MGIIINGLKLIPGQPESLLMEKASVKLSVGPDSLKSLKIIKKSVDARRKNDVRLVYSVAAELDGEANLLKRGDPDIKPYTDSVYRFPEAAVRMDSAPVIVGAGPAGLFCALTLARLGLKPILLERGRPVEERVRDVERLFSGKELDPESNVQFGEGGAGTFSDGKLNTGIRDPRLAMIRREFIRHGAPEEIEFLANPHIGTDKLRLVIQNMRRELTDLGCDIRFSHRLSGLGIKNGRLEYIRVDATAGAYEQRAERLVLAAGHSARDVFELLCNAGVLLGGKPFAVGVRVEHLQREIAKAQYGDFAEHPELPVPGYRLSCRLTNGRSAFSFCVCPGGVVTAASSEPGGVVTNGMSDYAQNGVNINGGLLVNVRPEDFGGAHPLAGVEFQRQIEAAAYVASGGYMAPAATAGDFLAGRVSRKFGRVEPTYRPGTVFADLDGILPRFITESLREAIPLLGRKLSGFDDAHAVLTAPETRSSSPVRILRDEAYQSNIRGLYPCGEGAGYAGGIMSAAADGVRVAEAMVLGV